MVARILMVFFLLFAPAAAWAETFTLTNGDRITGDVVTEDDVCLSVKTQALGIVVLKKAFIKKPEVSKIEEEAAKVWKGEVSIGYEKNTGNTRDSSLTAGVTLARKRKERDETTFKVTVDYSSSGGAMDKQEWYGLGRYARSLGKEKKWYDFYSLEADHDRFGGIDYRLSPSAGLGYWFSDNDDLKLLTECGIGVQYTQYNNGTKNETEPILTPRLYLEKALWGASRVTEEFRLYPSLGDLGVIRLRSETSFINPINETLSLKLTLTEEYDSQPGAGVKKNDLCFTSELVYSF